MKEKKGNFWIWGLHSVLMAAERRPEILSEIQYVENDMSDGALRRIEAIKTQSKISLKAVAALPRTLDEHRHQGIAAHVKYFPLLNEHELTLAFESQQSAGQWLVLDGIEDPRNFGAILRSAAAFNVHGVIVGEKFQAPVSGVVSQASAGTCFLVPIYEISSTLKLPDLLPKTDLVKIVGLDGSGASLKDFLNAAPNFYGATVWIVGAEGKGIHARLKQKIPNFVSIPMHNGVESLNASVATGIVLYEGQRTAH